MVELTTMLAEKYGDVLELEDVDAIMTGVDVTAMASLTSPNLLVQWRSWKTTKRP